ncbi:MAG: TIGR01777 family protein [candidate division Zixibacteria bacterium]|nr:TIGR01777 family protein [candidate division Zixibacteria bacterium]
MRVLITGGTGFIGGELVRTLAGIGHSVTVLSRQSALPLGWPTNVQLIHWPGPPTEMPEQALEQVDAIVNLAGESIGAGRWTNSRKDRIFESRILTTRLLVARIATMPTKPKLLISGSAIDFYGSPGDTPLTEASPPGNTFLAVVCSHWEDEAKAVIKHGVRLAILRTGLVWGPRGGALPRIMLPFKLFVGGPLGSGNQVLSWIHRDDLIGLIRFILENDHVSGPINATAPNPVPNRELSRVLGKLLRRPSFFRTPAFILRLALGEMSELVLKGQRVLPKRALEYKYAFQFPELEGALRNVLNS